MEEKNVEELLPRSFVVLRELWTEMKKKAKRPARRLADSSAHAPVLSKKRSERR